jgi:iron complex outermembrane receptor protein
MSLYASVTRGFKSGGFNLLAVQPGFKEEQVWSYEAGLKSELADGRVRLNGNVFYMDYTDMQVGQIVNLSSVLTNAGESRLYGAEIELTAIPVDALELGATVAYLNTEYQDFCTGDPTQPKAPISPGCTAADPIQLKGNELPRAPEWAITAAATYTIEMGDGGSVALHADARYQADTYFTQFNRPLISQDAYTVVNARITWTDAEEQFNVGAWANNLFDKDYFTEVLESGAFNPQLVGQAYVAPPRTYGVSVGYNF